jgi:hypothetical protein
MLLFFFEVYFDSEAIRVYGIFGSFLVIYIALFVPFLLYVTLVLFSAFLNDRIFAYIANILLFALCVSMSGFLLENEHSLFLCIYSLPMVAFFVYQIIGVFKNVRESRSV